MSIPPDPAVHEEREAELVAAEEERSDRRALIAIAIVVLVVVLGLLLWWLLSDDDEDQTDAVATTTTSLTTTTTAAPVTEPPATAPPTTQVDGGLSSDEVAQVVFPYPETSRRFSDPVAAVQAFATELVGFTAPVLGTFAQGDSRSGEVEVRDRPDGLVTTVLVRQFGPEDSWWVIGASTPDILIDQPAAGATVSSPMRLVGTARAFEGTVETLLHRDGDVSPIATGFVTGGGGGEMAPFDGELAYQAPPEPYGALVARTTSAEDGSVLQATVLRVAFSSAG